MNSEKTTMSVDELKEKLGIGRRQAYQLANSAGFPSLRVGRRILISIRGLEQWIEDNRGKAVEI